MSRFRRLDRIDFGINPPVPSPSASIASSPFVYILDDPAHVDLSIASFHDDCLDASLSSPWRLYAPAASCATASASHSICHLASTTGYSASPSARYLAGVLCLDIGYLDYYVDHSYLPHNILDHGSTALTLGYLDIGTKGYRLV